MRQDAQHTDAHQTNKNLLLSEGAEVDTDTVVVDAETAAVDATTVAVDAAGGVFAPYIGDWAAAGATSRAASSAVLTIGWRSSLSGDRGG